MSQHHPRPIRPASIQPTEFLMETDTTASNTASADGTETSQLDSELSRKNIPGFVTKLYKMVSEGNQEMIRWSPDGSSFIVVQPDEFSRHMLPRYFKHGNFSSFVRQLNMYGFHKVPQVQNETVGSPETGSGPVVTPSHWEFANPNFRRGRFDLLLQVKRKTGKEDNDDHMNNSRVGFPNPSQNHLGLEGIFTELQHLRAQQDALRSDISSVQRENQMLWNETMSARERHLHQQQVIEKILRFLASIFVSDKNLNPTAAAAQINRAKRQLLLEDVPSHSASGSNGSHGTYGSGSNIFVPQYNLGSALKKGTENTFWDAPMDYQSDQQQRIFNFIDTTDEMGHDIDELQKRLDTGRLHDFLTPDEATGTLVSSAKKRKSSPVDETSGDFDISNFLIDDDTLPQV